MATVEYRNIGKSYGAVPVIRDLSFGIADRQFVVLLGPSGCGKTTLLRMTAGLESITRGEVRIDDRTVNDRHPRDRDIAMVFQNYALYPTMKVRDNIGFSLEVAKLPPAEVRAKVERAAEVLNLTPYLDRYPKELSGGQRQRVAMGRAMVREPSVFLFDEPLSNLDAKLRAHMRAEIRQLHDRLDTTTIYVTHDQIEAMTMADRIVVMRAGDVEQIGTPDEVYDRPASRYVADFIGAPAINFLDGTLAGQGAAPAVETASGTIPVAAGAVARAAPGQRVVVGVRPTDAVVDPAGPIQATTRLVERLGHDVQVVTGAGGGDFVAVVPRGTPVAQGAEIRFSVPPDKVHVFDAATEKRL